MWPQAPIDDKRLDRLFDYTKFWISVLSLVFCVIAARKVREWLFPFEFELPQALQYLFR
jgi:hypothetical protein